MFFFKLLANTVVNRLQGEGYGIIVVRWSVFDADLLCNYYGCCYPAENLNSHHTWGYNNIISPVRAQSGFFDVTSGAATFATENKTKTTFLRYAKIITVYCCDKIQEQMNYTPPCRVQYHTAFILSLKYSTVLRIQC